MDTLAPKRFHRKERFIDVHILLILPRQSARSLRRADRVARRQLRRLRGDAMTNIIPMPIEKRGPPEPPQPVDDLDRWVSVLFICTGLYDDDGSRELLLHTLLTQKFSDVPDAMPSQLRDEILRELRDPSPNRAVLTAALARYAVKRLLKALTANDEERRRARQASDATFAIFAGLLEDEGAP